MTWAQILTHWPHVEADLHEVYGIDVGAPGLLRARSWRWLRTRIEGLLSAESRLARLLTPDPPAAPGGTTTRG
ncbi:hypothetical protein HUT08_21585 [Streptomyces buecherae]|uniref:Uncharacterized protein n=1 Tax=Streptomyces buecherae TaxID=2763006 RepID=A0A7H8NJF2_9ACTN|nr:hypothetical protein [Streptomyces buecherae]QKW54679.1 hypothetical protein HUT08_21585 [Streptomyces buecherae]